MMTGSISPRLRLSSSFAKIFEMKHTPSKIDRSQKKQVMVGNVPIGGCAPISIQSMTTTRTTDIPATLDEIKRLEDVGCDIVRVSVPDMESVHALEKIVPRVAVPIVADIHFDYRIALASLDAGIAKLRMNPGNIGARDRVEQVVSKAKTNRIPIRIGVNAGSLEKELLEKYQFPTPEALVESAMNHIAILEDVEFFDIVLSLKASAVPLTINAYRLISQQCDYPLHIGISEAGPGESGIIYSAVGLGILLSEGIGDTMRVSLTAKVEDEVRVAKRILASLEIQSSMPRIISCPTCARNRLDLFSLAEEVEKRTADIKAPISIAVMGCAVNGPGEAREADFGIAGGDGEGLLFANGEILRKVPEKNLVDELEREIRSFLRKNSRDH
jgi:(E)-4-hydroxy-3-methylbut-2-enyl-diphosphate synthase